VLRRPDGPLDETVPAERSITLRDLLTFRLGFGMTGAVPMTAPIMLAATEREVGVAPPKTQTDVSPDVWLARFSELPLMFQPGTQWAYQTGATVLGILIARASGRSLDDYLRERIFGPLGMRDTGFFVPASELGRLATEYVTASTGGLTVFDDNVKSRWAQPPVNPDAGGDLVSTVNDYLAFARMMSSGGAGILSADSIAQMTTNQLTPDQATFDPEVGWGLCQSVVRAGAHAGEYGWSGGLGTVWFNNPVDDLTAILLTQRMWESPTPPPVVTDFVREAYSM
jgi:CubicO group peptidase (beta-lactamase class C family)